MNNIDRNQKLTIGIILSAILIIMSLSLILFNILHIFLFEESMRLSFYFSFLKIFPFVFLILYSALLYFLSDFLKAFALNSVRISFYILIVILIISLLLYILNRIIFTLSDNVNPFIYSSILQIISILLYAYIGISLLYFKKDNIRGLNILGACCILTAVLSLLYKLGCIVPLYQYYSTNIHYYAILGIIDSLSYLLPIGSILLLFINAQGYLAKNHLRS